MKLSELIVHAGDIKVEGSADIEIEGIAFDSRKVERGFIFFAINGNAANGEDYIDSAVSKGAAAVAVSSESDRDTGNTTCIRCVNIRKTLSAFASAFYGNPSRNLRLVGVTGTNGKTTTATLLYRLFSSMGYGCGLLSTIENRIADEVYPATHTTPDPVELNRMLGMMNEKGCEYCFMEVSSHALSQERTAGLQFAGAIFTNLTHDHLDYHGTFANYLSCKKKLFDSLSPEAFALVNIDDRNAGVMLQNCKAKGYGYSCRGMADHSCRIMELGLDGMLLKIDGTEMWTTFIGQYNASNLLAVYSAAVCLGADREEVLAALSALGPVSGRFETIRGGNGLTAIVDYAHTPDALENILSTIRGCMSDRTARLCTVFGCGGDRDRTKRPEMAEIAVRYSDRVIITSDNPRTEDPDAIIADIRAGIARENLSRTLVIKDRAEAIRTALLTAEKGSVILVAGKGHETYQITGTVKTHFDDREVIRNTFLEMEQ